MDWLKMLAIAGMNGGGSGGSSGGVSPEEVTTIVKEQFPGGVGYSEVTEVGGDTLSWDGNTEGLGMVTNGHQTWYRVSDAVPTKDDCVNGVILILHLPDGTYSDPMSLDGNTAQSLFKGGMFAADIYAMIIPTDDYLLTPAMGESVLFPKAGVWFVSGDGVYTSEFTIPGYNGFKTVTKTIKHIATEFLPEHLQFGADKAFEPIVWDGNTEGLESVTIPANEDINRMAIVFYKVMDKYIPITDGADIESYSMIANTQGNEQTILITPEYAQQIGEDFAIVTEHGCVCGGYVVISDGDLQYPDSLVTIPHGVWFCYQNIPEIGMTAYAKDILPKTTTTPISAEYLPETGIATIVKKAFPGGVGHADKAFEPVAWDCVVDGHETAMDGMYVKISDEYIPIADKSQLGGLSMKTAAAGEQILPVDHLAVTIVEHYWGLGDYAVCTDGTADFGGTVLSKGLWVMNMPAMYPDDGFTGMTVLPGEIIDTINRKYLPGKVVGILPALPDSTGTYFLDNADAVIQAIKDERDPYLYYYDEANNKHYYYHLNTIYNSNYWDQAVFVCVNAVGDTLEIRRCTLDYSTKRVTGKIYKIATAE